MRDEDDGFRNSVDHVAIIGFSLRVPGAATPEEFWLNIATGQESLSRFNTDELDGGVPAEEFRHPDYVPVRGIISDVEAFDAEFFGFSPREAQITDPQQRVFLECAYAALEQAGHAPDTEADRIGVFAGAGSNTYLQYVIGNTEIMSDLGQLQMLVANEKDHIATRTAYRLGLRGPAVTIQTSCSTSLVAVHFAVQSLLRGEADIMLAGGASISLPQRSGYRFAAHDVLSPDGHCRAFADDAHGTVPANGVGVVVLRRLRDALAAGDTIYAVISGSAINNDGGRKAGYAAPSVDGQIDVIRATHRVAGVSADTIHYVEAHGTGTEIGDGIEVAALTEVFRESTDRTGFCAIGSVKPNIGHVDTAAGVTGLIKAALAVWHGKIPPSINSESTNPHLRLESTPFYLNRELRDWPAVAGPRRAGVSSFGIGGTNAHIVLEQAPSAVPAPIADDMVVVPLSAHSPAALTTMIGRLGEHSARHPEHSSTDIGTTLQQGRRVFDYRSAAVVSETSELRRPASFSAPVRASAQPTLGFVFTGQGNQYPGMARELYDRYAVFRESVDACAKEFEPIIGTDIRWLLCDDLPENPAAMNELQGMRIGPPSIFTVEYATARLLMSWGMRPAVLVGHSLGEYAAACVAGAMEISDMARLIAARGELLSSVAPGSMMAVYAAEAVVIDLLPAQCSLAAINSPQSVVVAGPAASINELAAVLGDRGIGHKLLPVPVAGHSAMLDPVLEKFRESAIHCRYGHGEISIISSLTGKPMGYSDFSADYWTGHLRNSVRFSDAVGHLLDNYPNPVLIEVGPGQTLTHLVHQVAAGRHVVTFAGLPGRDDDAKPRQTLLAAAVGAWCAGSRVNWNALTEGRAGRRVPLPTYPFARTRHWLDTSVSSSPQATQNSVPRPDSAVCHQSESPDEADKPAATAVRTAVADIWAHLLGIDDVHDDTNFFAIGGDSLLLVRMITQLRETFGVLVPLRTVAARPTLRAVVDAVLQHGCGV